MLKKLLGYLAVAGCFVGVVVAVAAIRTISYNATSDRKVSIVGVMLGEKLPPQEPEQPADAHLYRDEDTVDLTPAPTP
jgi:hypothetical protein